MAARVRGGAAGGGGQEDLHKRSMWPEALGSPTHPTVVNDAGTSGQAWSPPSPVPVPQRGGMDDIDDAVPPLLAATCLAVYLMTPRRRKWTLTAPPSARTPPNGQRGWPPRIHSVLWMTEGDMEQAGCIAYAFLNEDAPTFAPTPFIRSVVFSVAGPMHYRMFPSSRGHILPHFDSRADRDAVVDLCPIIHDGGERSEEMRNRFIIHLPWLTAISTPDFPVEHCTELGIKATFRKVSLVVKIDPDYIWEEPEEPNYSCVRVVLAWETGSE